MTAFGKLGAICIPPDVRRHIPSTKIEATATRWERGNELLWNSGRNRGLKRAIMRIPNPVPEIERRLETKPVLRILEIGCGYGKLLLDLNKQFGDRVELHGVNLEPEWDQENHLAFARDYNRELRSSELSAVTIHISDASNLPFHERSFDLILSVAAFHYFPDKLNALTEISRVLFDDGLAYVDVGLIGSVSVPQDTGPTLDVDFPEPFRRRLEVWKNGTRLNFFEWITAYSGVKAKIIDPARGPILLINGGSLNELDAKLVAAIDLHRLCDDWWGTKSIYRVF